MPTSGLGRPPRYHSYLLRCWSDGPGLWRFSVEDPHTGARRGFITMAALVRLPRRNARCGGRGGVRPGRRADRCLAPLTRPSACGLREAALPASSPTHDALTIHLRSPGSVDAPRQYRGTRAPLGGNGGRRSATGVARSGDGRRRGGGRPGKWS